MSRARVVLGLALAGAFLLAWSSAAASTSAVVVQHGRRSQARVALTFDDGVSPANCRRILAALVGRRVPATFFPIAAAMRADREFWQMVVAEGDPIGDHTLTHPQMPSLTEAQQFHEIDAARRLAESISGAPLLPVFRPPYGAYDAQTLGAAGAAGFPTVLLWDTSDRDTSPSGTVAQRLAAAEKATDGSVILMHCGPNATPYVLGPLLDHLETVGLTPVTVPDLLGLRWTPAARGSPPTPSQILEGLAPLPPSASGGVIVGPSGIGTMTFPPAPSPSKPEAGASGPAPTSSTASAAAGPVTPPASQPVPSTSPGETTAGAAGSAAGGPGSAAASSGSPVAGLIVVMACGAVLALAVLAVGLRRRRGT